MEIVVDLKTDEVAEIERTYERLHSLNGMMILFAEKKELHDVYNGMYEKIVNDIDTTRKTFNKWWEDIIIKYGLQKWESCNLRVDFNDHVIIYEEK